MSITSGYNKYKRYTKLSDGTYKLVSQWTNSNTVEMDNGSTLQATLGNTSISGIGDGTVTGAIDSLNSKTNKIRMLYEGEIQSNFTITSPGWYPDFYLIFYRVGSVYSSMIIGDNATYNISYTDSTTSYNTTNYQVFISITRNKDTNTDQYVVKFSDWLGSRPSGTFTGKFHYLAKVYGIRC